MTAATLERLRSDLAAHTSKQGPAYLALVKSVCDGNPPDAAQTAAVLASSQKSFAVLEADVVRMTERRKMRASIDAVPVLQATKDSADRQIAFLKSELDAAKTRYQEANKHFLDSIAPIQAQRDAAVNGLNQAEEYRRQMAAECETVRAALGELSTREAALPHLQAISDEITTLKKGMALQEQSVAAAEASGRTNDSQYADQKQGLASVRKRLDGLQAKLRDAQAAWASHNAQKDALAVQAIDPDVL